MCGAVLLLRSNVWTYATAEKQCVDLCYCWEAMCGHMLLLRSNV